MASRQMKRYTLMHVGRQPSAWPVMLHMPLCPLANGCFLELAGDQLDLWLPVPDDAAIGFRRFEVFRLRDPIPEDAVYVGSVRKKCCAWHVFERTVAVE